MFKQIIINLPTNIGDSVMALPVIDRLHANYPQANITLISSKLTSEYLSHNTFANKILFFDKHWKIFEKIKFSLSLRGKYDLVIDLKNSILPLVIGAKHTSFFRNFPQNMHSKDIYLSLIEKIAPLQASLKADFALTNEEKKKWDSQNLTSSLFIACTSNAQQKRYPYDCLKQVVQKLVKDNRVVILGQESDRSLYKDILSMENVTDFVGKTKIHEVFYLIKNYAKLLLCVDSSILHIGSYLNTPIVAIFGQTSIPKYGPWSEKFITISRTDLSCIPCNDPHCKFNYECMDIQPANVIEAIERLAYATKN